MAAKINVQNIYVFWHNSNTRKLSLFSFTFCFSTLKKLLWPLCPKSSLTDNCVQGHPLYLLQHYPGSLFWRILSLSMSCLQTHTYTHPNKLIKLIPGLLVNYRKFNKKQNCRKNIVRKKRNLWHFMFIRIAEN